ncbi:MAG: GNAT family N-acetyltransferase [Clostridia bacterium]|nr:GNAT family N-acetyltransferase [Clostridia bacterium]
MPFFNKTVIETERLLLRRWTQQDMNGFLRFAADPGVMMAAGARPVLTPEEARADLKRCMDDPYCFAITLKSTGEIVGKIKYQTDFRRLHVNSASVGYELARQYWGNGYMTEALRGMVRHAFDVMGMDIMGISHFTENERSRRVIERAGFYREGVSPRAFRRFDGMVFDEITYSLLREEYLTGRPAPVRSIL